MRVVRVMSVAASSYKCSFSCAQEASLLEYNIVGALLRSHSQIGGRKCSEVPDECPGGPIVHLGGCAAFDLECLG